MALEASSRAPSIRTGIPCRTPIALKGATTSTLGGGSAGGGSPVPAAAAQSIIGGGLAGVASKIELDGIKTYKEQTDLQQVGIRV